MTKPIFDSLDREGFRLKFSGFDSGNLVQVHVSAPEATIAKFRSRRRGVAYLTRKDLIRLFHAIDAYLEETQEEDGE